MNGESVAIPGITEMFEAKAGRLKQFGSVEESLAWAKPIRL